MSPTSTLASPSLIATFRVRNTLCALDASTVQEVIRFRVPTPIRHAPPEILGVINLRGKIVSLLDLGLMLGFEKAVPGPESRIFIVEDRGEFLGLLADSVAGAMEMEEPPENSLPANIPASQARFFQGVYRNGARVIALLNASEILSQAQS